MRTTIDIPDDLFRSLKVAAAERGVTLKTLICDAAAKELSVARELNVQKKTGYRAKFPLIRMKGRHKIDLTNAQIEDLLT